MTERANGHGEPDSEDAIDEEQRTLEPPPEEIAELAEACVTYVERETKIKLDYTPETLPLVDHWLRERRSQVVGEKDEVLALVAGPVGAYLGEVARRQLPLRWFAPKGDFRRWRIELENVFLSMNPIGAAMEALALQEIEGWGADLRTRPQDESRARAALENLPEMELDEYFAPSTRLEVLQIVADALSATNDDDETEPRKKFGDADYGASRAESAAEGAEGEDGDD